MKDFYNRVAAKSMDTIENAVKERELFLGFVQKMGNEEGTDSSLGYDVSRYGTAENDTKDVENMFLDMFDKFLAHFAVYAVSGGQCFESLYEYSHEGRFLRMLQKVGSKDIEHFLKDNMLEDSALAVAIHDMTVTFDDIKILDGRTVQKCIRKIDNSDLAKALKGEGDEICNKVFCNMSKRSAAILKEDMEFMGPVRLQDVCEAQRKIGRIMSQMYLDGEIVIES